MSGEGEGSSRPSSLVLEAPAPEREPLHFDVQLIGAPPEVEQLVNNIKQVAEDFLYHWKTFPIVLPPSRFTGAGNKLSDIIIPPPCDELDTAALDAGLEPEPLSPKQLHSIREKGEFEVPSRLFPGQTHVWRVAGWLQRGRARAREQFLRHVARAAALVLVVARDRLLGDGPVTLRASLAALSQGLYRLLDLLIGMPSMEARDLEKKIREERSRYLVAELICKPEHAEDVAALAAWVGRCVRRAEAGGGGAGAGAGAPPRVPVHYSTPQRTAVDLRLHRRDTLRRAAPALQPLLEREARGWFLHFRERTAAHLAAQKVPASEIEEEVRAAAMQEYVSRVCGAVAGSGALAALGAGVPALLADQLRAAAALRRADERVAARSRAAAAAHRARTAAKHPLLARSGLWSAPRAAAAARRVRRELRWAAREEAAAALQALRLPQHRYFLLRDLAFLRDREPLLAAELRAATVPTRTFAWRVAAWREPDRRHTVVKSRSPMRRAGAGEAVAARVHYSSTRWAGWRLCNVAHRTRCWTWNALRVLLIVVAWESPLSARALLRRDPAPPDLELSQVKGTSYPARGGEAHTVWSRLRALWRRVAEERARIDAEPDTGLVAGGWSRGARRAALAGAGGLLSLLLLLLFPLLVLLTCALALLCAAAVPLCAPPAALALHAFNALVYDLDCPRPGRLNRWFPLAEAVVWRVCVLGLAQPLAALVLALALGPAAAVALAGGVACAAARACWEALAWRAVIARRARVPRHDSVFCRRVAGPGVSARASLRLSAAQAVAAAAARAELAALAAWQARVERAIERPLRDYEHFVDACFGPFSVRIAETGSYRQLARECAALAGEVRGAAAARRRELACPLSDAARARCRLAAPDLRRARAALAGEVRRAWRAEPRGEEWWGARGLEADDWPALAADALLAAFSADVLLPLDAAAPALPLDSAPGGGVRLWEGVAARAAAPPDVVGAAGEAWGGAPRVAPPALDLAAFSPRAPPHPPLPSPAMVALLLHNRDSDTPLPLESELCAEIVRALEDAPDADADSVERYRGGGSSDGSGSELEDEEPRAHRPYASDSQSGESSSPERAARVEAAGGVGGRGACRWTLTGRGVRLRADLASPEDVTLDAERRGTSV